jgi:sugar lactone lactonase YvrE
MRSDLDGNGPTRVLQGLNRPRGLAFHEGGLFFSDYGFGQIVRVNRSATSGTVLIPNALGVRGIAIDPAEKKLYWTDRDLRMVLRSNLDGSDEEVVISQHLAYPYSIQIDAVDKFVYVEDHLAGAIFRARFDGTELTRFADVSSTTQNRPGGLALDTIGRSLYYKDAGGRRILRAPLRGSLTQAQSHEVVLDGLANPNGLTIDPVARQLYWAESAIWRANLDGTDKQQLPYTDSSFIAGIHVVYP